MLYDLIANVTLDSVAGTTRDKESTVWKVHLAAGTGSDNEKWFMIQDLIVEETRKEMIFLGETILQVKTPDVHYTVSGCTSYNLSDLATQKWPFLIQRVRSLTKAGIIGNELQAGYSIPQHSADSYS